MRHRLGKKLQIEIRADSGFARNARVQAGIEAFVEKVMADFQRTQQAQRQFSELLYQADSWDHPRRMIAKVGVGDLGLNRRFVVSNRGDLSAEDLYEHYMDRGQAKNFVKAFKKDLAMDRLRCHRFLANQFRLWASRVSLPVDGAATRLSARHPLAEAGSGNPASEAL